MKELLLLLCRYPFDEKDRERLRELIRNVKDWKEFVNLINAHGIIALAAYNIKTAGLEDLIPADSMVRLENGYLQSVVRNTWLTERWKEVNEILNNAGISHILLKGMALEHTLYESKGLRQMNDNDILIKPEHALKAWQLLQQNGFSTKQLKSPLFKKLIFELGQHLPALYKNGYIIEIHDKLSFDGEVRQKIKGERDPFESAREIFIGETKALILSEELELNYLVSHFERHTRSGECQLRLYTDIRLLDNDYPIEFPDEFVNNPKQGTRKKYLKISYKNNITQLPAKHRLRFIIGDTFPTLEWMKKRYKCNGAKAVLHYLPRIWKLTWLLGKSEDGSRKSEVGSKRREGSVERREGGDRSQKSEVRRREKRRAESVEHREKREEGSGKLEVGREIELITTILQSGNMVELPATGYSMYPTFISGDKIVVRPLSSDEVLSPGQVVIFKSGSVLLMHRLIDIDNSTPGIFNYRTRGDSMPNTDKPWSQSQLLGVAVSFKREGKSFIVKEFVPKAFWYILNRRRLWFHLKFKLVGLI